MLHQGAQAFDPVAIIAVQNAANLPHFRPVNMAANDTVVAAVARLVGQCDFKIGDEIHRHLDLVFEVGRERPIRETQALANQIEIAVNPQSQLVGVVAQVGQPLGKTDHAVEIVTVGNPHAAPVGRGVDRIVHDLDAAKMVIAKASGKLVVVARHKNHLAAFARPAQELLHHIIVRLGPEPALTQLPAVHNIAHQVQILAGVVL